MKKMILIIIAMILPSILMATDAMRPKPSSFLEGEWIVSNESTEIDIEGFIFEDDGKLTGTSKSGEIIHYEWRVDSDIETDSLSLVFINPEVDEDYTEYEEVIIGTTSIRVWTTYYAEQSYPLEYNETGFTIDVDGEKYYFVRKV